jgi:hypothetical protein
LTPHIKTQGCVGRKKKGSEALLCLYWRKPRMPVRLASSETSAEQEWHPESPTYSCMPYLTCRQWIRGAGFTALPVVVTSHSHEGESKK